jgi:hypothetical protein
LQAGYEGGSYGAIFNGSIKQVRRGRDNPTDTYLEILAADGDVGRNFGIVNTTLAAGVIPADQLAATIKAIDLPAGFTPDLPKTALSRGKVLYGMARDRMFYPIIGQMERAAGLVHDDTAQAKRDKLDALLPRTSISKQDAALFSEMLSLSNDGRYPALELTALQRRQKTMEALSSQMEALSRKFPVLMNLRGYALDRPDDP